MSQALPVLYDMTVNSYLESVRNLPVDQVNARIEACCGISCFFKEAGNSCLASCDVDLVEKNRRDEYGDWQTNMDLALAICRLLKESGARPQVIVEPTCGKGHFILASLQVFDSIEEIYGIEINASYLESLKRSIFQYYLDNPATKKVKINLFNQNVFNFNFHSIKKNFCDREVLAIGNPPWVTSSKLGMMQSQNLPKKVNYKKAKGLDAITGKGNFDIAEYICRQMIELLKEEKGTMAFLLKNHVIKNLVYELKNSNRAFGNVIQYNINTKEEFGASVAAALLCAKLGEKSDAQCQVQDFYTLKKIQKYGWVGDNFVSDVVSYKQYGYMDGASPLKWWSGVKHDCSKVMELTERDGRYVNGLGQIVCIENDMIYPLLKSSDIKGDKITAVRKYIIITQKSAFEDTNSMGDSYPLAYSYLNEHISFFDSRGSSVYNKRSRFSIFGIGDYSFAKYKVVISGLYKKPHFSLVGEIGGKPVMVDDTCYLLGFDDYSPAYVAQRILNSTPVQSFIHSLLFVEAKRVINKELLMRIDFFKIVRKLRREDLGIDESDWRNFILYLESKSELEQFVLF